MLRGLILCMVLSCPALADMVVPTRTIRAHAIIQETDVALRSGTQAGTFPQVMDVIGQEARAALYPGRPIALDDIGPPAIVARNQVVRVTFSASGLMIATEGRALERGAVGDRVRLMNLSSRTTLFGYVQPNGSIRVNAQEMQ